MTRIDFHTNLPDKLNYACRLARKAWSAKGRVVLLARDQAQAAELNAALWTLADTDFLPHAMAGDALAAQSPLLVSYAGDASFGAGLPHHDMLINLGSAIPDGFERFARVFEIISTDADDAAAGRQRYLAYKQKSYPLTHFVAGKS
ncbi:MAG: DNA polymerase III subunit chi [Pseudomonadota bacterium]